MSAKSILLPHSPAGSALISRLLPRRVGLDALREGLVFRVEVDLASVGADKAVTWSEYRSGLGPDIGYGHSSSPLTRLNATAESPPDAL